MNDVTRSLSLPHTRPDLPIPTQRRWQPLRLGLVELFHYDSEEFWFRDGHLLLRGNNGTGKSKVLSLTLPFLFDARLNASRIEPDGDAGKKMAWNLLMNGYDRRMGYAWVEFGRLSQDDVPQYLCLGAGLSAVAARPQVDSWYFVLEGTTDTARMNQGLWLTNAQRIVLTRERLREALQGRGHVFDTAEGYRRAVDERLFHLGAKRYDALMETLIQLRQPQLSKKPDERGLSNALTESLPPLASELLADVAEALGQLEHDRQELEEHQALAAAVERFQSRYRVYAGTQSRRQARVLRQAQTEFDTASRARSDAQARYSVAQEAASKAEEQYDNADVVLTHERARLDTLLADPTMQDANRLEQAHRDAETRRQSFLAALGSLDEVKHRLQRAAEQTQDYVDRGVEAEQVLVAARSHSSTAAGAAGIDPQHSANPLAALDGDALLALSSPAIGTAESGMRVEVNQRREDIASLRRRHAEVNAAETQCGLRLRARDEAQDMTMQAAALRERADTAVEREGEALTTAWQDHFAGLRQLRLDGEPPLAALAEWVVSLTSENPARTALQGAQQAASSRLATHQAELDGRRRELQSEQQLLHIERDGLLAGVDATPPRPYTRDERTRDAREGAPLWQLIEFRDTVKERDRAGLEAALESAGLLDAWVTPDGRLIGTASTLNDTQLLARPAVEGQSLEGWLRVDAPPNSVAVPVVEALLRSVACAAEDPGDVEAWVAPDGRFRLGALAGAWDKAAAVYIGFAARAAARARRIAEVSARLLELADAQRAIEAEFAQQALDVQQAADEWRRAPSEQALRDAHFSAIAAARDYAAARERLTQADAHYTQAGQALQSARETLISDATDLRLPEDFDALGRVEKALDDFIDAWHRLVNAVRGVRVVLPELQRQRARESELREDLVRREEEAAMRRMEAEEAAARLEVLRESVGVKVDELQRELSRTRGAVSAADKALKAAGEVRREAGETSAVAREKSAAAESVLLQSTESRGRTVTRFQEFAATGLLEAALPQFEMPDVKVPWTIDPALSVARRAEQALLDIRDDDATWARVQRQVMEDFTELQRGLSALGHQAMAENSDWGVVVRILYQNRPEPPDRLALQLAEEIAQRSELLSANEREVLENHLQAEIAAEVQRLLQSAERQVAAVNTELHKHPTSTGVRFRLQWQPLAETEGAPTGLEAARKRLLNTSADLWSSEDRSVVGAMFQQRIAAERERTDSGLEQGSLLDQLARALDYRHWHHFRVERWQDGQWRKLTGPASSGERALGLTVPLFAAVASFYSQSTYAHAPRLMLLDEAFAGIDDLARAHCMALIREFDLDFVMTSEREWGCYAALPGVAICQLQRREGIDAVFVSRWTWDGRAKTRDPDPDRRFEPV
jgi:uncharacterized protein (TIGR02680 family)